MCDWIEFSHEPCYGYNLTRPIYVCRSKNNLLWIHGQDIGSVTAQGLRPMFMGNSEVLRPMLELENLRPMHVGNSACCAPHVGDGDKVEWLMWNIVVEGNLLVSPQLTEGKQVED